MYIYTYTLQGVQAHQFPTSSYEYLEHHQTAVSLVAKELRGMEQVKVPGGTVSGLSAAGLLRLS